MPENSSHSKTDVIIIGAGAAGLGAAQKLSAEGLRVAVIEARSRVGGRIYTEHTVSAGVPIELGAEFIHGKPRESFDLAEAAHLTLCDGCQRHIMMRGSTVDTSNEFMSKIGRVMAEIGTTGEEDQSFQQFLDAHCDDEEVKRAATLFVQGFHAARADRIGVQGLKLMNDAADSIDGDSQSRIQNGYDELIVWLRQQSVAAGVEFHVNAVVEEVNWSRNDVEVLTRDGCDFRASSAIITLPLGVLQSGSVAFNPELPEKQNAARSIEMGQAIKVIFVFRERFWEPLEFWADLCFVHAPELRIPTWWTQLPVRAPVLVGWAGGTVAEKMLESDNAAVIDAALDSLRRILKIPRKNIDELLVATYFHNWKEDPFALGAYSYIPVGSLDAPNRLAAPVQETLFFAGEATNTEGHIGTVHGAIATGYRAASEVLKINRQIANTPIK